MSDFPPANPPESLEIDRKIAETEQEQSPLPSGNFLGIKAKEVENDTRAVQRIIDLLAKSKEDPSKAVNKETIEDPTLILRKLLDELTLKDEQSIEDILRVLIASGVEIQAVQAWLQKNKNEIASLVVEKKSLETHSKDLSADLDSENKKGFVARLFSGGKRKQTEAQLEVVSVQAAQAAESLKEKRPVIQAVEVNTKEVIRKRERLALEAVEILFKNVLGIYNNLRESLTDPAIKKELNDKLIAEKLRPVLDELLAQGRFSEEDITEYEGLIVKMLATGRWKKWGEPEEVQTAIDQRFERLREFNQKSGYKLDRLVDSLRAGGDDVADKYYDGIFDLFIREMSKDNIDQVVQQLGTVADLEFQRKISRIAEEAKTTKELDLSKIPLGHIERLPGLNRWQVVKDFAKSSGAISNEVIQRVERTLIKRLFEESLFPGGRESGEGTSAVHKITAIGNPEALPLLLKHVETFGTGHTSNEVVYAMEDLLNKCDSEELQQVLESLPPNKRIILELLADENSYLNQFGQINSRYVTCELLKQGGRTLTRELLVRILDQQGYDPDKLQDYYVDSVEINPEIMGALLESRDQVEATIINSKLDVWPQSADKLLAALVNPRNGDSAAFPVRIAKEGIGISDEKTLDVIDRLYATKVVNGSGFEREALLDGFVMLNAQDDGRVVLETILNAYRGTKSDPKRIRRIFQFLSTLNGLGEYGFEIPNQDKIDELNIEIENLQKQDVSKLDKGEKKKIKDKIERLTVELNDMTGLKGIEDVMRKKVVEAVCKRFKLPDEYKEKVEDNLEELMSNGIFEIVPALSGNYEARNESEVRDLLNIITLHIIDGDFKKWRYAHELSGVQLEGLTDDQKRFWSESVDVVIIEAVENEGDSSRREDELRSVKQIAANIKEHILETRPDLVFSVERQRFLVAKVDELNQQIISSKVSEDKKKYISEKKIWQAELDLTRGILEIENANPKSFTREKVLAIARELREGVVVLELPLAGLDVEQIGKVFTVGDIKRVTAYESDDAATLLKVGVEPQETCQSWRQGAFNECLLAYVADSNKKVVNVANDEGKIVARSIIKLTDQTDVGDYDGKTKRKTIMVEKPYTLLSSEEVYRAFARVLLTKAQGIDSSITFGKGLDETLKNIFVEEAKNFGYVMKQSVVEIYLPRSMNKYEYSDTLGGKLTSFGSRKQLETVVFEKI